MRGIGFQPVVSPSLRWSESISHDFCRRIEELHTLAQPTLQPKHVNKSAASEKLVRRRVITDTIDGERVDAVHLREERAEVGIVERLGSRRAGEDDAPATVCAAMIA